MNKTRLLGIGVGRGGNVLLDEFLSRDRRYTGLYVNSAYGDMEGLKHFNINKNAYIFPAANGSGRIRSVANDLVKDNIQGLADTTIRYVAQEVIVVFFSMDGGTGSGTISTICQMLRKTNPQKKINLVAIIPDYTKADRVGLENTLACWNDIVKLSEKNIVDDIKFVDNSKRKTFEEINKKVAEDLDNAFTLNGKCEYGSIDDNDAKRVNTAKGYGLVLTLDGKYRSLKDAIDASINESVFAQPNQYSCEFIAASLKDFNPKEAIDHFEYSTTSYVAKNSEHNTIVLGGSEEPSEIIETIKIAYDELIEKANNKTKSKRTIVDINLEPVEKTESAPKTSFTSKELDSLFDDLF